jgi:uncharacterized protein DUF6600/FecR-like protein
MLRSHRLERLIMRARAACVCTENRGFVMKTFTDKSSLSLLLCLAGLLSFVAPRARADEEKDPPTRVARISFVDGTVSLQPGGQGDWGSAAKNRPMTIGDKIWVDKDSRAELQAGTVAIHLGSMTALSFLNLDQGITQVRLAEGSLNFRVSELREGDLYEVDAPNLAFTVKQAGAFRIDVNENGDSTRVTVIRGEGEVTAGGKTYPVHAEERAEFTGTEDVQSHFERAPGLDGLDRWAAERDQKEDNSISGKYVSRDMDGYSDLDDSGTWRDEPEYGHVWYPRDVEPGWAPYSNGYWNWVDPWGWTWVDYSPWGFAPFHYGRWNYFAGGWGWCPGPFYGPSIYGPAFVGFFGGGFGFGVGWFPLGFGEPFFPGFRCRHEFFERINTRNTFIRNRNVFNTNVRNFNFVNAHNVHAVTTANRNAFTNGHAINRGATHLTEASLKGARVTNSVGIKPTQHSALGSANIRSHVPTPSAAVQNRAVIARTAPAAGASQMRVHTVNSAGLTSGRSGNGPFNNTRNQRAVMPNSGSRNTPVMNSRPGNTSGTSGTSSRQHELSQSRPPSSMTNSNRPSAAGAGNTAAQRGGNSQRAWEAQGNATDRGRAPAGFGSSGQSGNSRPQMGRETQGNRPPWAHDGSQSGAASSQPSRPSAPSYNNNRPNSSNGGRAYEPPQRSQRDTLSYNNNRPNSSNGGRAYEPPQRSQRDTPAYNNNRGNSQPRSYNPAPSPSYSAPRTYSAPSRSYPAPSRSNSAPSRSNSGGGGGNRGGGGGGSPHGGGSSAAHGHR